MAVLHTIAAESGRNPLGWWEAFESSALTTSSRMPWCGAFPGSHLTTELGHSSPALHRQWAVQTLSWSGSRTKVFLKEQHERRCWLVLWYATPAPLPPSPFLYLTGIYWRDLQSLDPGVSHLPFTRTVDAHGIMNSQVRMPRSRTECHLCRKTITRRPHLRPHC